MFGSAERPRRLFTVNTPRNHCDGDGMDFFDRRRHVHRNWMMAAPPPQPPEYYLRAIYPPVGVGGWRGGFSIDADGAGGFGPGAAGRYSSGPRNYNGMDRLLRNVSMVEDIDIESHIGPVVTSFGTLCVFLECQIRVDITLDQAIRLVNPMGNCMAAMDSRGSISCLVHPSGKMYQNGAQVDIRTAHNRTAKLSHRGIAFAKVGSPVVYLLDDGGARTTVESFVDLSSDQEDISLDVFYGGARYGQDAVSECLEAVLMAEHSQRRDNTWRVNGVVVTQVAHTGDVYVSRDQGRRQMKTSPVRGNVSVTTPYAHACASSPPEAHLFVRRGERRIHSSLQSFNVRNGSHSAGFDEGGKFKVY